MENAGQDKSRIKKYKKEVADCSISKFVSIKAFGVVPRSPLQAWFPCGASLAGTAVPAGTVPPPAARAGLTSARLGLDRAKLCFY